jgi:hypothetical protein
MVKREWCWEVLEAHNLFFGEFVAGNQSDGLHVSKFEIISQEVHVENLADVFLAVVAVQFL